MYDKHEFKAKICLVGDSRVGKTSLIRRYVHDDFDDKYISTLGAKITKKEMTVASDDGPTRIGMTIWDIMGERSLSELLKESYFDGAGGVVAVCDLTRKETFEDLEEWISRARDNAGPVHITFVGNKADLHSEQVLSDEDLAEFAERYDSPYYLTSAKTGESVEDVFQEIAQRIVDTEPSE